jgi:C4-dicarboxylate-specific signal transduction histidine kinase
VSAGGSRDVRAASRAVAREIDSRIERLERELETYEELRQELDRLRKARAALTGEPAPSDRISQDQVADYLRAHPGSRAKQIAEELGTSLQNISAHLYRGKQTRFESRPDGWYLREPSERTKGR